MRKAYKIVGLSTTKPENLPNGFSVQERSVGEVYQVNTLLGNVNFVETKTGDIVIYKEGVQGTSIKIPHERLRALAGFLLQVYFEHSEAAP